MEGGGEDSSKHILGGQHYPDINPEKDTTKKKKLQINIFDGRRCKNSQENINKLNSTTHYMDHTL